MDNKLRDKRTWVKGILVDCPLGKPMPDCPGNNLRGLPLAQFVRVVNNMSEKKLDAIITYHETCVSEREGSLGISAAAEATD
jgi:hypothetical protein